MKGTQDESKGVHNMSMSHVASVLHNSHDPSFTGLAGFSGIPRKNHEWTGQGFIQALLIEDCR